MHQGKFQQNQMRSLRQKVVVEGGRNKRFILLGIIPSKLVTRLMSITHLETHQSSSQQIKIMTHITPGEIIAITNKCQIPWTDLINTTLAQGHHLPSIDNSMIEEEKAHATKMVSSWDVIFVKVCIIWPRTAQKNMIYTIHNKSFFFNQISTTLNRSKTWHLSLEMQQY